MHGNYLAGAQQAAGEGGYARALTEEERERSYIILVPPTLLIILNSDSAFYRIVRPRGAETIDIHQTLMVPESYRQVPNFKDLVAIGASTIGIFVQQRNRARIGGGA